MPKAASTDRACRRSRLPALVLALGVALAVPSMAAGTDAALERVDALVAAGAWQLALQRIEALQDGAADERWEALERRRFRIYRRLESAEAYAERVAHLPRAVSPEFRDQALQGLFATSIDAGDDARAHEALAQLAAGRAAGELRPARERLARLYLERGQPQRALEMLAPLPEDAARELRAEALLYAGREREAFEQAAGLASDEARLWRLLALWRLGLYAPEDAVTELSRLARALVERPRLLRLVWLARAEAAARAGELMRRVHSLEQALQLDPTPATRPVAGAPDHLWSAYLSLARHVATREDLALDAPALARAEADTKAGGRAARALYAWLALEADDAGLREQAHARLVQSLLEHELAPVVRALYTGSERFAPAQPPAAVRHALLHEALARGDLRAAAGYARALEAPPGDQPEAAWQLRRARVLLYGGATEAAVALLARLVELPAFDGEYASRWVQVVFDLQALGRHDDALRLLEAAQGRVDNARMRRELLYWRAESASALGRYPAAAELYLRSAQLEADGRDSWGHSARYRAAEALATAGLRQDAEAVYRALLAETSGPRRRLLIEQHLERLWLDAPRTTR